MEWRSGKLGCEMRPNVACPSRHIIIWCTLPHFFSSFPHWWEQSHPPMSDSLGRARIVFSAGFLGPFFLAEREMTKDWRAGGQIGFAAERHAIQHQQPSPCPESGLLTWFNLNNQLVGWFHSRWSSVAAAPLKNSVAFIPRLGRVHKQNRKRRTRIVYSVL